MTESSQGISHDVTDYDRVGGGPAVKAVVDRFYELLLADDRLARYFFDTDMNRLKRHQVLLVSQVMGGPMRYGGRDLQQAHAGLDISRDDFTLVVSYLGQSLREAGVPSDITARVGSQLAATRADVVAAGVW